MLGKKLGSYRIVREIGSGGMGEVYLAEHVLLGKPAAIKRLRPEFSGDEELVTRLFNEARATTLIHNRGIVEVFDFGFADDGSAYLIMELLDGETLTARLASRGRLPEREAVRIARQMASALAAAHDAGIIHRDLKPDNVMLVADSEVAGGERVKILDFGIAKLTEGAGGPGSGMTQTGRVMGTPHYMSPEQCAGAGGVDHRSDVYALGCVLYLMVCGRPPFIGGGSGTIIAKHIYEKPEPPRTRVTSLSSEVDQVILNCLRKSREDRFQDMRALIAALEACREEAAPEDAQEAAPIAAAAAVGTVPSTMSAASGEVVEEEPRRPGRGRGIWIAGAAVAAIAAGAVFLALPRPWHRRVPASPPTAAATVAPADAAVSRQRVSPPGPSAAASAATAAAQQTPPDAASVPSAPKSRTGKGGGSRVAASSRRHRHHARHPRVKHRRHRHSSNPAALDKMFGPARHDRAWGRAVNPFQKSKQTRRSASKP